MVLMKKGEDTRYVADIFIPHYLDKGYEVIFPKKKAKTPAQVVVEKKQEEAERLNGSDEAPTETIPSVNSEPAEAKEAEPVGAEDGSEPIGAEIDSEPVGERTGDEDAKSDATANKAEPTADNKQLACPICGKQYAKKAYLLKHIEKEHPED